MTKNQIEEHFGIARMTQWSWSRGKVGAKKKALIALLESIPESVALEMVDRSEKYIKDRWDEWLK